MGCLPGSGVSTSTRPLVCLLLSCLVLNAGEQLEKASAAGTAEERPGSTPLSLAPPLPFQKSQLLSMLSSCSGEWGALFPLQHLPSRVRAGGFPIQDQPLAGWLESQDPTHLTPSFWTEASGPKAKCLGVYDKQRHCWASRWCVQNWNHTSHQLIST